MAQFEQRQEDPHKRKDQLDPKEQAKHQAEQAKHGLHGAFMDHLKDLQNSASKAVGKIHPGEVVQHGKQAAEHLTDPKHAAEKVVRQSTAGAEHAAHQSAQQATHGKAGAAEHAARQAAHGKPGTAGQALHE